MDKVQQLLRARLNDNSLADSIASAYSRLRNAVQTDREVVVPFLAGLEQFCTGHKTSISTSQLAHLRLFADVLEATHGSLLFCDQVLQADTEESRAEELVLKYYAAKLGEPLNEQEQSLLRVGLFERYPTAVVAGLVSNGQLQVGDKEHKEAASNILCEAVHTGTHLEKQSLANLLTQTGSTKRLDGLGNNSVYRSIAALQRLIAIVVDPLVIPTLVAKGFNSAREIAATDRETFSLLFAAVKGPSAIAQPSALAIWQQASIIDARNQRAWTDLISKRQEIPVLAVDQAPQVDASEHAEISLENLFRENESFDVDENISALSPAAYLVDLLQLLRYSFIDPHEDTSSTRPSELHTEFLRRRPDIAKLELSLSNTLTPIAYADLVNEVLEAYIAQRSSDATETAEQSDSAQMLATPHTNWALYRNTIQHKIAPLTYFPFSLADEYTRHLLPASGITEQELLAVLGPYAPIASTAHSMKLNPNLLESSLRKRVAASYLNLSQLDFLIITGEAFISFEFWALLEQHGDVLTAGEYQKRIGLRSTAAYWGFDDDDDNDPEERMVGSLDDARGLDDIKGVLLPRSGLSYVDLLALLRGEFLSQRLVISVENSNGAYSGRLEDMRLCSTDTTERTLAPFLDLDTCADLLSMIKLWRKTGWSLDDLDNAVVTLSLSRLSGQAVQSTRCIDAEMILDLAAIGEISESSDFDIRALMPLWSAFRTGGTNPLYVELFYRPHLIRRFPKLNPQDTHASIGELVVPLLAVLKLSSTDLHNILEVASLREEDDWNLEHVAKIYRYQLLCMMLDIETDQLGPWLFWSRCVEPFASPRTTLRLLNEWNSTKQYGWSSEEIFSLLAAEDGFLQKDFYKTDTLAIFASIWDAVCQVDQAYSQSTNIELVSSDDSCLLQICSTLFEGTTAEIVVAFINATWKSTFLLPEGTDTSQWPKLTHKVDVRSSLLIVSGVLSDQEHDQLLNINKNDDGWTSFVNSLYDRTSIPWLAILSTVSPAHGDDIVSLLDTIEAKTSLELEARQKARRKLILPALEHSGRQKALHESIKALFNGVLPNLNSRTIELLLKRKQGSSRSLFEQIDSITQTNTKLLFSTEASTTAGFIPVAAGEYSFTDRANIDLTVTVGNQSYPALRTQQNPVTLSQGRLYICSVSDGLKWRQCQAINSIGVADQFSPQNYLHERTMRSLASIVSMVSKAATTITKFGLNDFEIEYFNQSIDLTCPERETLELLGAHAEVRDTLVPEQVKVSLLDIYKNVEAGSFEFATLPQTISKATKLPLKTTQDILGVLIRHDQKVFRLTPQILLEIRRLVEFTQKIPVPITMLVQWASLSLPGDDEQAYQTASSLEAIVSTQSSAKGMKASQEITAKRQTILVQYLMTEHDTRGFPVRDIDSLFEYFLIDVQMGPQLQTSRIKQAISTVQLFIQRSLLGLEKKNGIPTTAVNRTTWDWMSKFTLWQANRKVFLYPENWAEPSLRDDKSEVFRNIETIVMQNNMTIETVNAVVRQYIYQANEVADLEIITYFWEATTGFQGKYHLFARTRSVPYIFHHRILHVTGIRADLPKLSWYPWSKLDVDIPVHETDWDAKSIGRSGSYLAPTMYKGRLFLFIPQIILRTRPKKVPSQIVVKSNEATATNTQNDHYWEMKMGWVELRSDGWSKKEVSMNGIEIDGSTSTASQTNASTPAEDMPSIKSFHFRASSRFPPALQSKENPKRNEVVIVDVFRWLDTNNSHVQIHVGRFELRGTQVIVGRFDSEALALRQTIPTRFQRLDHTTSATQLRELQKELVPYGQYNPSATVSHLQQPFISVPPWTTELQEDPWQHLTWTISYNEVEISGASGLMVERTTSSSVDQYFGIAMRDNDGNFSNTLRETVNVQPTIHSTAQPLMEAAAVSYDLSSIFDILENVPNPEALVAFGVEGDTVAKELSAPYSIYNWELGFHLILLLMERMLATQQFELALQVASMVFDPKADDEGRSSKAITFSQDSKPLSNLDRCWKFLPFKNSRLRLAGSTKNVVERLSPGHKTSVDIDEWLLHPFSPHAIARTRPMIYMRRFIIKYIEILVAAGDLYFRQDTLESIPFALQYYVQASQLFGQRPQVLPSPVKPVVKTYNQISADLDDFASAMVDMELEAPFFVEPSSRATVAGTQVYNGVQGMVQSTYFGVPANPQLAALRDLIDDRFTKIRNCLDIDGNFRMLPLFDPPLDPGDLVRAMASGGMAGVLGSVSAGPLPNYRFVHLLKASFNLCSELRSLSASYLSIKEKRDSEALSTMIARQRTSIQNLALQGKKIALQNAMKVIEVTEAQRLLTVMKLRYYLALVGEQTMETPTANSPWKDIQMNVPEFKKDGDIALSPQEVIEHDSLEQADKYSKKAGYITLTCSILKALPEFKIKALPMGLGGETQIDPKKVADGLEKIAEHFQGLASSKVSEATAAVRREQIVSKYYQRKYEANAAGYEVSMLDKEIEQQQIRVKMQEAEIELQEQTIKGAAEVEAYLQSKYTNEALYAWMDGQARQVLYQTYLAALAVAKDAEKAFQFERKAIAKAGERFLAASYWNDARNGAFCADNLALDLRKLETAYRQRKPHDYEITKDISLKQLDVWALLRLQETASTEFILPEVLFDYDFPGHFCRRIKSVSVTVTTKHGVSSSISCTLRLLEHGYRLRQDQRGSSTYYPALNSGVASDSRYHTDKIPITAIAVGQCEKNPGSFGLSFAAGGDCCHSFENERYGPFEGAGVISKWSLDLPEIRQFDYRHISDVVLHMSYTASEGGALWKQDALTAVRGFQQTLETALHTSIFDLTDGLAQATSTAPKAQIIVNDVANQLPFWTRGSSAEFLQVYLVATQEVGMITDTEENLPRINSMPTANSLAISEDARGEDGAAMKQVLEGLGTRVEVVELKDGWSASSAGGPRADQLTVDIAGHRIQPRKDDDSSREKRMWMLLQYKLRGGH